jgi:hypothetical protein
VVDCTQLGVKLPKLRQNFDLSLPFGLARFILTQMLYVYADEHFQPEEPMTRSIPMAKSKPTPTQQTGGTSSSQQQGQDSTPSQQQGQTIFRDWASI